MAVEIHKVGPVERNTRSNLFRIHCSCGWFHYGESVADCETRAATHDIEWVEVDQPKAPAHV